MSEKYNIRKVFCSRYVKDGIIAEFDFSQLEVAALAEISNDSVLLKEVNNGVDIHTENAALWLKCKPEDVTKEQRKKAKIMTFQLQYGAGPKKMSESLNIRGVEAAKFIGTFYDKYKGVNNFHAELAALRDSYQETLDKQTIGQEFFVLPLAGWSPTGRLYTIPARLDKEKNRWYISLTEMKNYPIQGFATADVVPIVINMIYDRLIGFTFSAKLINTVHDSFVIDCHADEFGDVLRIVEQVFTQFPKYFYNLFDYKLKAVYNYDVKFGWNLSEEDMKKLTREEVQLFCS